MIQEKGLIKKWHQKDFRALGFRFVRVVQAIHHQAEAKYDITRGIMSVIWTPSTVIMFL